MCFGSNDDQKGKGGKKKESWGRGGLLNPCIATGVFSGYQFIYSQGADNENISECELCVDVGGRREVKKETQRTVQ